MLNKVILIGNVGKDPEVRKFPDTMVCNLTLATTEKFKDKDGNMKDATEWHNLQIWGKLGEIAEKYVKKGSQIYVEGKIKQRAYETESKQKKYITEIIVSELKLLGKKEPTSANNAQVEGVSVNVESDLPF